MKHRFLYGLLVFIFLMSNLTGVSASSPGRLITPTPTPQAGALTARVADGLKLDEFLQSSPFEVVFSEPMDPASADPALLTYPYVDGKTEWAQGNTHLIFHPTEAFDAERAYHVFLDRDLKSASGKQFEKIQQWQIQVLPGPQVTGHSPKGPNLATVRPLILINFDRQMDAKSLAKALHVEPEIDFTVEMRDRAARILLEQPFALGQSYRFTLDRTARDVENVPLAKEYSWQYWVPEMRGEAEITDDSTIEVKFNYSVRPDPSVLPFQIDPPIAGTWSWSGLSVEFQAEQPLPYATRFTIRSESPLTGDEETLLPLEPVTIARKPPIGSVEPFEGADDWSTGEERIFIAFTIPMDHASTEAAFKISPEVAGHFEWNDNQMLYQLDEALESTTDYTITINPSARSADGKPVMLEPYSWSFRSGYAYYDNQPDLSFGCEGGNAQVVDANGRRSIYFDHGEDMSGTVGFSLYKVDLPAFAELFHKYYQERSYLLLSNAENRIPTHGLERTIYWQEETTGTRVQETRIPSNVPTGLYVLNASLDGVVKDQLLVSLTYHTLVVKQSAGRLWVWASDINGQNVPDLEMRLYTEDGSLMREGKTDAEGIFETTLPKDSPPMLVAGRAEGDDVTISGFYGSWGSNWWWYDAREVVDQRAYVYTDRPIYKPGHTIHFKTILRLDDDTRYSLPEEGTPVHIRVLDPRENEIYTFDLQTNAFGTVHGEFTVAEGAGLGEYIIRVEVGKEGSRQKAGQVLFKVEDYRKPEFQVTLAGEKDSYVAGETIAVDINTRYFFDEPVPNARLSIRTFSLASWNWWYDPEDDSQQDRRYTWYAQEEAETVRADEQGHYLYEMSASVPHEEDWYSDFCRTSWRSSLRRCTMAIEVTATDASGQSVSGYRIVEVFNAAEKYTLDTGSWVKKPGEKFTVRARAVSLNGEQPLANVNLRLDVLGWSSYNNDRSVAYYTLTTNANGEASQEISLPSSGSYRLRLSPDFFGSTTVSTSSWIYVYSGADQWAESSWGAFSISTEMSHYKPYEKARLAIQSNFSGPALLTFERGRVIHQQPVMLTAPLTTVETEIIPEYAPNVYVVVNAWQPQTEPTKEYMKEDYGWTRSNSTLRTERVELQVESSQKALNINIIPDQERYAPRAEASLEIQVTDAQDNPVEAELSLALVDEAIFSLSDELAGPIHNAFYGRREHTVHTSDSLSITRTLGLCGGGKGGGGGGEMSPVNPRSNFPDTAVWLPVIETDANGKATAAFTLPDSLTTWRVMVKAVTRQTLVGQAEARIMTHQEVIVQPVLPRALTTGDQFELGALVHNYTGQAGEFQVELSGNLLEMLEDARQKVTLQVGEQRLVRWMVKAAGAGETNLTISAAKGDKQDAVRLPLTIRPRGMPEVDTQVGDFQHEVLLTLVAPEAMLDVSTVEFKLSRSVAGSLLDGVDYLTGYPYGCVEQTMSRALPNAVVGRAFNLLGVENPQKAKLNDMIAASVQRLYGFQHSDGGWGWWHDDDSTPYQTAWVVFGLAVTKEAGYPVDEAVIKRGAEYLKSMLRYDRDQLDLRTEAYMLYSLAVAEHGDREKTLTLAESAQELDPFSQAALALALHKLGEDEAARPVLDALARSAWRQDGQAFWELQADDGQYYSKTMASSTRSTALALDAFVQIDPQNELIPDIARYLMSKRRSDGWGTTNETAFTILALTDHLQQLKETGEEVNYAVLLNDQEISGGTLAWQSPLLTIQIPAGQLKPGINLLRVTQTGDSPLFYTLTSRMLLDTSEVAAAGTVKVTREYLQPGTNKPVENLKVGDLVRVRLTAAFPDRQASYVIIEDPLPGGLEAVNERMNNSAHYGGRDYYAEDETYLFYWEDYGYNQKEIHGDRVSIFVTEVSTNSAYYLVDYLARVTQTGDFLVPPAQVYAMYDETIWGRSSSGELSTQLNP